MNSQERYLKQLPDYLFWDIDRETLSISKNKKTIIGRVLNYGQMSDWRTLLKMYGIDDISNIAQEMRDIDIKTATFVSVVSNTPLDKFKCFTMKPSIQAHWNF